MNSHFSFLHISWASSDTLARQVCCKGKEKWVWNVIADIYETVKGWAERWRRKDERRADPWQTQSGGEENNVDEGNHVCRTLLYGPGCLRLGLREESDSRRTCLSACHGAQLDVLLLLSWRRHRIPKRSNFLLRGFLLRTRDACFHVLDLPWGHAYLSDHLKVLLPAEINGFPVEEPLKFGIQGRIAGDLTRQNQALSCGDVQAQRRNRDPGGFYVKKQERRITFCCLQPWIQTGAVRNFNQR